MEKTDRQTDKLCTENTEEKTERKTATNATKRIMNDTINLFIKLQSAFL